MKKTFFIISLIMLGYLVKAENELDSTKLMKIIIMNDNRNRPIANTIDYFWRSKNLNQIMFPGDLYFDLVKYRLTKNEKDSVVNGFSICVAIIFSENHKSDTIYTDYFFRNWLVKGKTFLATDDFLRNMFGSLYLGNYKYMRKGED